MKGPYIRPRPHLYLLQGVWPDHVYGIGDMGSEYTVRLEYECIQFWQGGLCYSKTCSPKNPSFWRTRHASNFTFFIFLGIAFGEIFLHTLTRNPHLRSQSRLHVTLTLTIHAQSRLAFTLTLTIPYTPHTHTSSRKARSARRTELPPCQVMCRGHRPTPRRRP